MPLNIYWFLYFSFFPFVNFTNHSYFRYLHNWFIRKFYFVFFFQLCFIIIFLVLLVWRRLHWRQSMDLTSMECRSAEMYYCKLSISLRASSPLSLFGQQELIKYCLKNEQECIIRFKNSRVFRREFLNLIIHNCKFFERLQNVWYRWTHSCTNI